MNPSTQRDRQAENRRSQLLDIALASFAALGVENVSIKDLAAEAGVAQGLIYYYFDSKEALLAAVFERHNPFPQVQAIIREIYGRPVQEGLSLFVQRLARLMPEKRNIFRILLHELISPRVNLLAQARPSQEETVRMLARYFQERIDAGELKPHPPIVPIQMLISNFLLSLMADQPLDVLGPQLVETLLDGIRAR